MQKNATKLTTTAFHRKNCLSIQILFETKDKISDKNYTKIWCKFFGFSNDLRQNVKNVTQPIENVYKTQNCDTIFPQFFSNNFQVFHKIVGMFITIDSLIIIAISLYKVKFTFN